MGRLICVLSVYNEAQFLLRCLRSVRDKANLIVMVDGAYRDFPHDKPWSTDGTIEIAEKFCDKLILTKKVWADQIEKRNQYLVGRNGDWYLMLDGDEELVGKPINYETSDDWNVMLYRTDGIGAYPVYRLFRHRKGIRYYGTHHCLIYDGEILNHRKMDVVEGCNLIHFTSERNKKRVEDKGEYYRKRVSEQEFRRIYKL